MTRSLVPMSESGGARRVGSTITIGEHHTAEFFGMTFNLDTIYSTLLAGGIVLLLGFLARRALTRDSTDHVPTKLQILWESVVKEVNTQVEDNLGKVHPFVTPLAISLFFFILFANWLELLPTEINHELHLTPAPTADTNLTYAMAALVFVSTWIYGIRQRGFGGYFKGFLSGSIANNKVIDGLARMFFTLLNILEELIKPLTLALRLFGNIFAGGIMLSLIGLMPLYILWAPNLIWKAFDMFIGGIQAFIFALLTVLYFAMAGAGHGGGDEDHDEHDERHDEGRDESPDESDEREREKQPEPATA